MRFIKGFSIMYPLQLNAEGVNSAFGELSTYAATFSKEKGYYTNATETDVQLVVFSALDEAEDHFSLTTAVRNYLLTLQQWVYDQYIGDLIPLQSNHAAFVSSVEGAFTDLSNVEIGDLLPGTTATLNMPEYIQAEYTHSGVDYTFKIWFADAPFRAQYDLFEIHVINPLVQDGDLDDLYDDTAVVGPLLAAITSSDLINKVQTVIGTNPATLVKTYDLLWNDPNLPLSTLTTTWTIVIYGQAGDNVDNIKAAIKAYIDDNTSLPLLNWQTLYPDLYNESEFAMIPLWENIASPETMMDYGLYSPSVRPNQMKDIALENAPSNYGDSFNMSTHCDLNLNLSQSVYRSLAFLVVSYPGNPGAIFKFTQKFPDYMAIPTSSGDFARMSVNTQAFVVMFLEMLDIALELTPSDTPPPGYSKVTRGGKLYVAKEYLGTLYLVLTKDSYVAP